MPYFALDAGHGQSSKQVGVYDPGASLQGYQEHKLAKELVDDLTADLKALGHKVYLPIGLFTQRDDKAKAAGVDFYLSIHFNGGAGTGTEAFVNRTSATQRAKAFATDVSARLSKVMGIQNRGLKYANWAVLSANKNDALIEVCFPADVKKYLAKKQEVELVILNALLKAHGLKEVSALPRLQKEVAPVVTYRIGVGWAKDSATMGIVAKKCADLGVKFVADGPCFYFHANLDKTKQIEAVIAATDGLYRMHAILVPQNAYTTMGVAKGLITNRPFTVTW